MTTSSTSTMLTTEATPMPSVSMAMSKSCSASASDSSSARAQTLEVRCSLPSSSRMSKSEVRRPASTMAAAIAAIERRPA